MSEPHKPGEYEGEPQRVSEVFDSEISRPHYSCTRTVFSPPVSVQSHDYNYRPEAEQKDCFDTF